MCAVILEGKAMRPEVITGLDLFTTKEGDESDPDFVAKNTGRGKMYPCGPVCYFKGKQVPCMVSSTDSGSITSELLISFLEHMDKLELSPRIDGLKPFVLLNGHGSRLELPSPSSNTLMILTTSGLSALVFLMECLIGRLVILRNKMGHTKWH